MSWKKRILVAAVVLLVCCFLMWPPRSKVRETPPRVRALMNLNGIGVALHDYHDAYKELPPAVVKDKSGRPLYSWRVLLLPFLEHGPLYRRFKLDEPWNSPHNKQLLEPTPACYRPETGGWEHLPTMTHYLAFVGPGTAFERDGLTWKDFRKGLSNTLLVVEAAEPVPWSKPVDLVYDPGKPLPKLGVGFTKPRYFLGFRVGGKPGFNACFADASVRFISNETDEGKIRGLITRVGGEKVDASELE